MLIDAMRDYVSNKALTPFYDSIGDEVDRDTFLTASEAGRCLRRSKFDKTGAQKDNDFEEGRGYWERGHNVEKWVIANLINAGIEIAFEGDNQVSLTDRGNNISGTPDGLLMANHEILEIKSIDPRTGKHNLPRDEHVMQVRTNMSLAQQHDWGVSGGRLLYVNCSDYMDMMEFEIPLDDGETYTAVAARAEELFKKDADQILPEGLDTNECRYCPFTDLCGVTKMKRGKTAGKGEEFEKADLALSGLVSGQATIKELQGAEKKMKNSLRAYMQENNMTDFKNDVGAAALADVPGRKTLDRDAMEGAGIDVSPFEKTGKPSARLTITKTA